MVGVVTNEWFCRTSAEDCLVVLKRIGTARRDETKKRSFGK